MIQKDLKLWSVIDFLFLVEGMFKTKSEIFRLLKQNGLILHLSEGPWKPNEFSGMLFDDVGDLWFILQDYRKFKK